MRFLRDVIKHCLPEEMVGGKRGTFPQPVQVVRLRGQRRGKGALVFPDSPPQGGFQIPGRGLERWLSG